MILLFIQLFCACRIYPKIASYQEQKMKQANLEAKWLETDTFRLHYWEGGNPDGETLLFLHGFGGDAGWAWARNFADFSEKYHIIAPDLLWFGDSFLKDNSPLSLSTQTDVIEQLIEAKELSSVQVIGLSYGGFVAMELIKKTDIIENMILIGVAGWQFSDIEINEINTRFGVDDISDIFIPAQKEDVRTLLDICFYLPTPSFPKQLSDDLYQTVFGKNAPQQRELIRELANSSSKYTMLSNSLTNTPRTLLIIGETDPIFSVKQVNELAMVLEGTVLVYPRADHVPNVGYKRKFQRDVHHFLNQIEGTADTSKQKE